MSANRIHSASPSIPHLRKSASSNLEASRSPSPTHFSRLSERRPSLEGSPSPLKERSISVHSLKSPQQNIPNPSSEEVARIRSQKPMGRGAAKSVHDLNKDYVLVFANPGKEEELREEVETARRIRESLPETSNEEDHYIAHEIYPTDTPDVYVAKKYGKDLQKRLDQGITPREAFRFIGQIFRGGTHLHASNHVHGDLKPDNVFTRDDAAYLSDFGKTRQVASEPYMDGGLLTGNPRYSAPEQRLSKPGDVYSFALIAIHTLDSALGRPEETNVTQQLFTPPKSTSLENRIFTTGKIALARGASLLRVTIFQQEAKIHTYIDEQITDWGFLFRNQGFNPDMAHLKAQQLAHLFKEMTSDNPADRPNMEEVVQRYDHIMGENVLMDLELVEEEIMPLEHSPFLPNIEAHQVSRIRLTETAEKERHEPPSSHTENARAKIIAEKVQALFASRLHEHPELEQVLKKGGTTLRFEVSRTTLYVYSKDLPKIAIKVDELFVDQWIEAMKGIPSPCTDPVVSAPVGPQEIEKELTQEAVNELTSRPPLGEGRAKRVYEWDQDQVLFTPRTGRSKTLDEEVLLCEEIQARLPLDRETHLACYTKRTELEDVYLAPKYDTDLQKVLDEGLSGGEAVAFIEHLFNAGSYLHESGFIHGDIKPDNVLIRERGALRTAHLSDFGKTRRIATPHDPTQAVGMMTGNGRFSGPEQRFSQASDTYGLGLLAILLLDRAMGLSSEEDISQCFLIQPYQSFGSHVKSTAHTLLIRGGTLLNINVGREEDIHQHLNRHRRQLGALLGSEEKADRLIALLKQMTLNNPKARPRMRQALERYQNIFQP